MRGFPVFVWVLPLVASSPNCDSWKTCSSCVAAKTWTGSHCRWCPRTGDCHAEGSLFNKCSKLEQITDRLLCRQAEDPYLPTQVHLAFGGEGSMTVSWHTAAGSTSSLVRYGRLASALDGEATGESISYTSNSWNHHVTITGLHAATRYYYRCGDVKVSSTRSFTTAPQSGAFNVSIFGDWGYGVNGKAVATRARLEQLKGDVDFIYHVGDIAYADDAFLHDLTGLEYEQVYGAFMNWIENISDTKPYMVTVGNHESECHSPSCLVSSTDRKALGNFSAYNKRWRMPFATSGGTSNMWYSFDYGLAHFVSLDTETDFPKAAEMTHGDSGLLPSGGFGRDGEYLAWLEADLAKANASRSVRPWVFAGGHRPVYMAGEREPSLATAVEDLFRKYGVDVYFCGHVHSYARSVPVYNSTPTAGATTYVLAGGAGNNEGMDNVSTRATWNAFADGTEWGTGVLHVFNRTHLRYDYISSVSGKVVDSFTIQRLGQPHTPRSTVSSHTR